MPAQFSIWIFIGRHKRIFIAVLFAITAWFTLIALGTAAALFVPPSKIDAQLTAYRTDAGSVFEYRAHFYVQARMEARVYRELVHLETRETVFSGASERVYEAGSNHDYQQVIALPYRAMPGTYCMRYTVRWRPTFSLLDRVDERDMACARLEAL